MDALWQRILHYNAQEDVFWLSFILPKLNYINLGYEQDDTRGNTQCLKAYTYAAYKFYKPWLKRLQVKPLKYTTLKLAAVHFRR